MPKVILHYMHLKAMGEGIRMLLAYGDQEFEDRRIPLDQWPEIKPKTPYGQLPVLEINGRQYAETLAICRYLGHKYGLAGKTLEENLEIDGNAEFVIDIRTKALEVAKETDPEVKKRKQEENSKKVYPVMIEKLNEIVTKNNGHLALGRLTWADFFFAGLYDNLKLRLEMPDLDQKCPNFKKLHDSVLALPRVKEFVANSPRPAH